MNNESIKININTDDDNLFNKVSDYLIIILNDVKPGYDYELSRNEDVEESTSIINVTIKDDNNPVDELLTQLNHEKLRYTNGIEYHNILKINKLNIIYFPESKTSGLIVPNSEDEYGFSCYITSENIKNKAVFVKKPDEDKTFFMFMDDNLNPPTKNYFRSNNHRLFVSDKLKLGCYIIAKSGCSSIASTFYRQANPNVDPFWRPWNPKSHRDELERCKIRIESKDEDKYNTYKKFICLRDPISRFISIVNFAYSPTDWIGFPFNFRYRYSEDPETFINIIIAICRGINRMDNIYYRDEHFMTQSDQIRDLDIDNIEFVNLKDLKLYFNKEFDIDNRIVNKSKEKFITEEDLTEDHIKQIKDIFKKDFDLWDKVKDRFWKPKDNN